MSHGTKVTNVLAPKTTPLFEPRAGLFSTQLPDSTTLKKPEIPKSIRVTEPQTIMPKTTFQQQEPSAFKKQAKKTECQEQLS